MSIPIWLSFSLMSISNLSMSLHRACTLPTFR
ncbi:Uncharacterised protein [Segatella copri]|nr:Uncharacterised protein [Segatella copri]